MDFDLNLAFVMSVVAMVLGSTVFFFAHNLSRNGGK